MKRVEECQMRQVTALMKTLIGHGVLESQLNCVSDNDVAVSHDASMQIIPRIEGVREKLSEGGLALAKATSLMNTIEQTLRHFLEALCQVEETTAGKEFLALRASNPVRGGKSPPREWATSAGLRHELGKIFEAIEGVDLESNLDPEMLLSAVVDDETYAAYAEIDKLALDMEARSHFQSYKGHPAVAKMLVAQLLNMDQVDTMTETLTGCADKVSNSRSSPAAILSRTGSDRSVLSRYTQQQAMASRSLADVFELLGFRVDDQELEELRDLGVGIPQRVNRAETVRKAIQRHIDKLESS